MGQRSMSFGAWKSPGRLVNLASSLVNVTAVVVTNRYASVEQVRHNI